MEINYNHHNLSLDPIQDSADLECNCCAAYMLANEQLRADVRKLVEESNKLRDTLGMWRNMSNSEMRLRAGEMTPQEIRNVKAVLGAIANSVV
jgi:hypothetical protein